jgi:hypothetical protein
MKIKIQNPLEEHVTYEFSIPQRILDNPGLDQDLKDLLEMSLNETSTYWIKISNNHWDHLVMTLGIKETSESYSEDFEYNFYINGSEGHLTAYPTNIGWSILLFCPEDAPLTTKTLLKMFEESEAVMVWKGLHHMLDANHGGFDHPSVIDIASLIIFG